MHHIDQLYCFPISALTKMQMKTKKLQMASYANLSYGVTLNFVDTTEQA